MTVLAVGYRPGPTVEYADLMPRGRKGLVASIKCMYRRSMMYKISGVRRLRRCKSLPGYCMHACMESA